MVREFSCYLSCIDRNSKTYNILLSTRFYCNALFSLFGNTHRISTAFVSSLLFLRQVRDTLVSSAFTGGQKSSRFIVSRRRPSLNVRFSTLEGKEEKIMQRASTTNARVGRFCMNYDVIRFRSFPSRFPAHRFSSA